MRGWTVLGVLVTLSLGAVTACGSGQPSSPPTVSPTSVGPTTVPVGYVYVSAQTDRELATTEVSGKRNFVIGPKFMLEVEDADATDSISAESAETLGLAGAVHAAPGQEFVVTTFSGAPSYDAPIQPGGRAPGGEAGEKAPREAVVVDGAAHELSRPVRDGGTLIVSVPKGHHPSLRMTQGGRSQSVDLRTGQRVKDSLTPYYPYRNLHAGKHAGYWDSAALSLTVRVAMPSIDAMISPFAPSTSWAARGRVWWYVSVGSVHSECSKDAANCRVTLPRRDFMLVLPNGKTLHPSAGSASLTTMSATDVVDVTKVYGGSGLFGFQVPANVRHATLLVKFAGRVTLLKGKKKAHMTVTDPAGPARVKLTA